MSKTPRVDSSLSSSILTFLLSDERESGHGDTGVRIVLTNGDAFFFEGLRIDLAPDRPDLVMLREAQSPAGAALIVREEHILSVDFLKRPASPPPPTRIGF